MKVFEERLEEIESDLEENLERTKELGERLAREVSSLSSLGVSQDMLESIELDDETLEYIMSKVDTVLHTQSEGTPKDSSVENSLVISAEDSKLMDDSYYRSLTKGYSLKIRDLVNALRVSLKIPTGTALTGLWRILVCPLWLTTARKTGLSGQTPYDSLCEEIFPYPILSSNQPVAHREVMRGGPRPQRVLAQHHQPRRQLPVLRRVQLIQPAPQDADTHAARVHRRPVRRRIDPARQTRHHHHVRPRQVRTHARREIQGVRARLARPHHPDRARHHLQWR